MVSLALIYLKTPIAPLKKPIDAKRTATIFDFENLSFPGLPIWVKKWSK
jgi:hypothetical protein